jgi:hypothetical protein
MPHGCSTNVISKNHNFGLYPRKISLENKVIFRKRIQNSVGAKANISTSSSYQISKIALHEMKMKIGCF